MTNRVGLDFYESGFFRNGQLTISSFSAPHFHYLTRGTKVQDDLCISLSFK